MLVVKGIVRCFVISLTLCGFGLRVFAVTNNHSIEGYANKRSAFRGDTISFSIHAPGTSPNYTVTYLRYGGDNPGGNDAGAIVKMGPIAFSNGAPRDYSDLSYKNGLQWPVSFTLTVPANWTSGLYVAQLQSQSSNATFKISFIVKDSPGSEHETLVIASTNTWEAYNFWPGSHSFYPNPNTSAPTDSMVSFLRPNPYSTPTPLDSGVVCNACVFPFMRTEHLAAGETRVLRWLERHNIQYSMLTDYDIHAGWNNTTKNSALDPFKVVIISTHNEYWSDNMYKSFQSFLNRGGNVISISGNTAYHRVKINTSTQVMTNVYNSFPNDPQLWDNLTQSPDPTWTDFIPKKSLFGFLYDYSTQRNCIGYSMTAAAASSQSKLSHWSFAGIPNGSILGASGEIVTPSSRCNDPQSSGASGEEVDKAAPAFARQYAILGERSDGRAGNVIQMQRASAGQIFAIPSITASGSLASDDPNLTAVLLNVFSRFNKRSFSDFTSDGHTDLIVRRPSDSKLLLFRGDGAGNISSGSVFESGWSFFNLIVSPGDFDSDGIPDILGQTVDGSLLFYRGTGQGGLVQVPGVQIGTGWNYLNIITPGDFDGDGRADVLGWKSDGTIWLHRGKGDGTFASAGVQIEAGAQVFVEIFSPGDFDEDGHPDLLARKPDGTLWFFRGKGDGTLYADPGRQIDSGWDIIRKILAAGDFNGDGHPDVLAVTTGGTLFCYRGKGDGTFLQQPGIQLGSAGDYSAFDLMLTVW